MSRKKVYNIMSLSRTQEEWDAKHKKIIKIFKGHPPFWFKDMVISGLLRELKKTWK